MLRNRKNNIFILTYFEGVIKISYIAADQKVYKAAKLFSDGDFFNEVEELLLACLSAAQVKKVLKKVENKTQDDDSGYSAFLNAVNNVLGEDVYKVDEEEEVDEEEVDEDEDEDEKEDS